MKSRCIQQSGFSIIEVTVAIAIVSIGLLSILGAFGSLQQQTVEIDVRSEASEAIRSLSNYLQNEVGFESIYEEVVGDQIELVFLLYTGDEEGEPKHLAGSAYSYWTQANTDWKTSHAPFKTGQMFRCLVQVNEEMNHLSESEMPTDPLEFKFGQLALEALLFPVFDENQPVDYTKEPAAIASFFVTR